MHDALAGDPEAATALGRFVRALHRLDPEQMPGSERYLAGVHNEQRGLPVRVRDGKVREALDALDDREVDKPAAMAAWSRALEVPDWERAPRWVHGDLQAGNVLRTRLTAVIDFGLLGIGDPAVDLAFAWTGFDGQARKAFQEPLSGAYHDEDALWERARGWAVSIALIILPYYRHTSLKLCALAHRTLERVLNDR